MCNGKALDCGLAACAAKGDMGSRALTRTLVARKPGLGVDEYYALQCVTLVDRIAVYDYETPDPEILVYGADVPREEGIVNGELNNFRLTCLADSLRIVAAHYSLNSRHRCFVCTLCCLASSSSTCIQDCFRRYRLKVVLS